MFIEEIVMDGFKCYEERTVISNLDSRFNSIIGLNGSGKSNVIDAILFCFDLKMKNSMRVADLAELINIHKSKATVTLKLVDVPTYGNIVVSRTINLVKGEQRETKSMYKLNGSTCLKSTLMNIVKLMNISGDFIILQGHVTKLVNMTPKELRMMVESVAGTKEYSMREREALDALEKKEFKLKIAQENLYNKVAPYFSAMEEEKKIYEKNQLILEHKKEWAIELHDLEEKHAQLTRHKQIAKIGKLIHAYNEKMQLYTELNKMEELDVSGRINEIEKKLAIMVQNQIKPVKHVGKRYDLSDLKTEIEKLNETELLYEEQLAGVGADKMAEAEKLNLEIQSCEKALAACRENTQFDLSKMACLKESKNQLDNLNHERMGLLHNLTYDIKNTGIHGRVHELFEITATRYSEAIWTVLGSRADFLVVEDDSVASAILKKSKTKTTIIPLNKFTTHKSINSNSNLKSMASCLAYDSKFSKIFKDFLGEFYVFETREDARAACTSHRVKCVTPDGTLYDPFGTLTGGKSNFKPKTNYRKKILATNEKISETEHKITKMFEKASFTTTASNPLLHYTKIYDLYSAITVKSERHRKLIDLTTCRVNVAAEAKKTSELITNLEIELCNKERENKEHDEATRENERIKNHEAKNRELQNNLENELHDLRLLNNKEKPKINKSEMYEDIVRLKHALITVGKPILNTSEIDEIIAGYVTIKSEGEDTSIEPVDSGRIAELRQLMSSKVTPITMDPTNFNFLERNALVCNELKSKISTLEKDKESIRATIDKFNRTSRSEVEHAFDHFNRNLQHMIGYFPSMNYTVSIDRETYKINVSKDGQVYTLGELSGGQRSIVAMCLMFSALTYRVSSFYIFDEIDAALDMNYTQHIGEIIKREFKNAQFFVISLKNNMYDNANNIYQVYIEDKKSRIKRIK